MWTEINDDDREEPAALIDFDSWLLTLVCGMLTGGAVGGAITWAIMTMGGLGK